jgi:hypothetical protein
MCGYAKGKHVALVIDVDQLSEPELISFIQEIDDIESLNLDLFTSFYSESFFSNSRGKALRLWLRLERKIVGRGTSRVSKKKPIKMRLRNIADIPFCFQTSSPEHLVINLSNSEKLEFQNFKCQIMSSPDLKLGNATNQSSGYISSVTHSDFTSCTLSASSSSSSQVLSFDFKLMTHKFISTNIQALQRTAFSLMKLTLLNEDFLNSFKDSGDPKSRLAAQKLPKGTFLIYFLKAFLSKLLLSWLKLRKIGFFWELRFMESPSVRDLSGQFRHFSALGKNFVADPFIWSNGGNSYCFFEYLDSTKNLGRICAISLSPDSQGEIIEVLEEPFHLSFPYIFEYENEIFMCPESSAAREIRIYKCEEFPHKWRFHKTIMKDVNAADAVLFPWDESWWLLTSIDLAEIGDHSTFLNAYKSSSPLSDDWTPHRSNPIRTSAQLSRNAGLILENKSVIRISQSQGFNSYGRSIRMSRIETLDLDNFEEGTDFNVSELEKFSRFGLHHLDCKDGLLVFDTLVKRSYKN